MRLLISILTRRPDHRQVFWQLTGLVIGLLTFCLSLRAEEVTLYGLSFAVEEVVQVDGSNSRVTVGEKTQIVPTAKIKEFVSRHFLLEFGNLQQFGQARIQNFVAEALSKRDITSASLGLRLLTYSTLTEPNQFAEFIQNEAMAANRKFAFNSAAQDLILEYLKAAPQNNCAAVVLFWVGFSDASWLRENAIKLVYSLSAEIHEYADRVVRNDLLHGAYALARERLSFLREVYGAEEALARRLELALRQTEEVSRILNGDNPEDARVAVERIYADQKQKDFMAPILNQLIYRSVRKLLKDNQTEKAFHVLSAIDPDTRSPLTHELALNVLSQLDLRPKFIPSKAASDFYIKLAGYDSAIKDKLVSFFEEGIINLLASGEPDQSERLLEDLLKVRTDPHAGNDEIRVSQAIAYTARGSRARAKAKISSMASNLSIAQILRLVASGYYMVTLLIGSLVLIIVIAALALKFKVKMVHNPETNAETAESDFKFDPGEVLWSRNRGSKHDEYSALLQVFGLSSNASLREIKSSYRALVKMVHPDRQNISESAEDGTTSKFIDLTRTYEKILEIREELGLRDRE